MPRVHFSRNRNLIELIVGYGVIVGIILVARAMAAHSFANGPGADFAIGVGAEP